jgi:DnaJ family protein C protein 3
LEPEDADTHLLTARLKYFSLDSQMVAMAHVKQCLHYDPEHKQCKALFRQLKKLDKEIKKVTEDADNKKWSAAMRKVAGPVGKPETGLGHIIEEEMNNLESEFNVKNKLPCKLYARMAGIACQGYAEVSNLV